MVIDYIPYTGSDTDCSRQRWSLKEIHTIRQMLKMNVCFWSDILLNYHHQYFDEILTPEPQGVGLCHRNLPLLFFMALAYQKRILRVTR
ncbi:hypothetical protein ACFQ1Y_00550 [Virgibacillus alimentarius]